MNNDKTEKHVSTDQNVLFTLVKRALANSEFKNASVADTQKMEQMDFAEGVPQRVGNTMVAVETGGIHPFRGQVHFIWRALDEEVLFEKIEYRIDKGRNSGGNGADVDVVIIGADVASSSTDGGIQDGQWHTLITNRSVRRSKHIMLMVSIQFDRAVVTDPAPEGGIGIITL
ncbi:MAG TPA: hypothetical protein VNV36_22830 [Pseudomonas sp.]|uniref:hypothetical protein n=1 Tax=Pseudomonas sp. TaxID=306 RepID=UPI002CBD56DB|nr:hypothetical protein [Pseudomonas sp.]HWH89597.1 hypothetical protein [Pseudomonas sp.]